MTLTDSEREHFIALANETFDPGLWSLDEYPVLKAAREEYEREQAKERGERPSPATEHDSPDYETDGHGSNGNE